MTRHEEKTNIIKSLYYNGKIHEVATMLGGAQAIGRLKSSGKVDYQKKEGKIDWSTFVWIEPEVTISRIRRKECPEAVPAPVIPVKETSPLQDIKEAYDKEIQDAYEKGLVDGKLLATKPVSIASDKMKKVDILSGLYRQCLELEIALCELSEEEVAQVTAPINKFFFTSAKKEEVQEEEAKDTIEKRGRSHDEEEEEDIDEEEEEAYKVKVSKKPIVDRIAMLKARRDKNV
jgi:hypothetical protein